MADLYISRTHTLGLDEIRKLAFTWAEHAENEFGMSCIYEESNSESVVFFTKTGIKGNLTVTMDTIEIEVRLGMFLFTLKNHIESEIIGKLDALLGQAV